MGENTPARVESLLHEAANLLGRSKHIADEHRGKARRLLGSTEAKIRQQ